MRRHFVVLTPDAAGAHGVAAVTRQVVRGLSAVQGGAVEVWGLAEARADEPGWPTLTRSARGVRRRFVAWGLMAPCVSSAPSTTIVALHLHLAPVALPSVARGGQLAVYLHGIEAWTPLGGLRLAALRRATLIANSRETVRRFREANPVLADRPVTVCAPGISPCPPAQVERMLEARRHAPPRVLIVGRLAAGERYKGHDELLEAWPRVAEAVPGATLIVVGDGNDRPRLEAKARGLGLAQAVEFAGRVDDRALAGLYASSVLFAMPSRGEGFGVVYLEAMRVGLPVVACPGAAEEIVEAGRSGWIVNADRPAGLAEILVEALSDRDRLTLMGRAAADRSLTFSEEAFATRLRETLGAGKGRLPPPRS